MLEKKLNSSLKYFDRPNVASLELGSSIKLVKNEILEIFDNDW